MDNINIKWITDGITPDAVEWAENFGSPAKFRVKTHK